MNKSSRLFGTDGVRGKANEKLTADLALKIGQAAGILFRNHKGSHRVLIGKDTRRSGYMIENALVAGFTSAGLDVQLTGPIPTPGVAMLTSSMRADLGVMVSASHNLFEDNGIKLFDANGFKLSDEKEDEIERLVNSDMSEKLARGDKIGRAKRIDEAQGRYIESAKRTIPKGLRFGGLRVVIDCANGAAYEVAPKVLKELDAEVFAIGISPDGTNINRDCGSTSPSALVSKVLELRADVGIALDGDADRVVLVDEKGHLADGDMLIAAITASWCKKGKLASRTVVGTVMSNLAFERYLESLNIVLVRSQVGDRYVLEAMREHGSNLGGEQSGHVIMSDYAPTGDGLAAALQVIAAAREEARPVSEVVNCFSSLPQILRNLRYKGQNPLDKEEVRLAIQEGTRLLGHGLVVRLSGTEPLVRVMGQGDDEKQVAEVVGKIIHAMEE